jgi:hypothetical protein
MEDHNGVARAPMERPHPNGSSVSLRFCWRVGTAMEACRAAIDRRSADGRVLGDTRRDVEVSQIIERSM